MGDGEPRDSKRRYGKMCTYLYYAMLQHKLACGMRASKDSIFVLLVLALPKRVSLPHDVVCFGNRWDLFPLFVSEGRAPVRPRPSDRGIEAETTDLGTVPVALPGDSEGLPPPQSAPAPRALIMSPRTGSLGTDAPARGFPC